MTNTDLLSSFFELRRQLSLKVLSKISVLDVSILQMHIMMRLSESPCSIKELSEYTISDKGSVSRSVSSLERMGFLQRSVSEEDQRLVVIKLTPTGKNQIKKINEQRKTIIKEVNSFLEKNEQAEFMRLLKKLSTALGESK